VARVLDATLWARHRVIGVPRAEVERVVEAIAGGGETALRATLRDGEADVIVGRGGARLAG
ncbi:MAG: hypothetical protein M3389_02340, partial [Actinomycetota bacterium]|nr:hypothetical protein [Actinomycetota bacterium]